MNLKTETIEIDSIFFSIGRVISVFYLLSLSTVLMPFYNVGINSFFLVATVLSIILFFLIDPKQFRVFYSTYFLILVGVYSLSFIVHFNVSRISSFLYSLFFLFSFCLTIPNLTRYLSINDFGKALRIMVYAFLIVMLMQQVAVVSGFPIINLNPEFSEEFLGTLSWFRINSLSSEPSYGATILAIIMIVYFYLFRKSIEIIRFWIPALYTFICFNSSLAIALVVLVILLFLAGKRVYFLIIISFIAITILLNIKSENRLVILVQELDFQDFTNSFISTDLSGAFRIIPNYFYFLQADPGNLNFYLGHGVDYATIYISRLMPGLEDDFNFPGGALPFLLFDYGVITFIAFCFFLLGNIRAGRLDVFCIFAIFVMINANFNTQLMWIFITLFYSCRFYLQQRENQKANNLEETT